MSEPSDEAAVAGTPPGDTPQGADAEERWCRVCGRTVVGRVCERCALDLETGELVGVPEQHDHRDVPPHLREAEYAETPARPLGALVQLAFREATRAPLFLALAWVLLCVLFVFRGLTAVFALAGVAFLLVWRCTSATLSPLVASNVSEGYKDPEDLQPAGPMTGGKLITAALEAGLFTLFVCAPASLLIDEGMLGELQKLGIKAPFLGSLTFARISAVGTSFVALYLFSIWIRTLPRRPREKEAPQGDGLLLEQAYAFVRAFGLFFCLVAFVLHPASILLAVVCLPLLLAGFATPGGGGWTPLSLLNAWRARRRKQYARLVALSAPFTLLLLGSLSGPLYLEGGLGFLVLSGVATLSATALAVLTGIDHFDTVTRWRRVSASAPEPIEADLPEDST